MHDPFTVAWEIKYPWYHDKPWPKKSRRNPEHYALKRHWKEMPKALKSSRSEMWPEGYRNTFITIWHVDPEKGGSDDSCGWSYVNLSKKQVEVLRNTAWHEGHNPHFMRCASKEWTGTVEEAECLHRGMVLLVCRVLKLKVSWDEVCRHAAEATHIRECSKVGGAFCFLAGYHSNSTEDSKDDRQNHFHGILCNVARNIITDKRPWWKHPRWHFWHWKFQCHPLDSLKRWAFSRCCKCGGRFSWGYSPVTNSWYGTGPRWFRGESDVFHSDCNRPSDPCIASANQN